MPEPSTPERYRSTSATPERMWSIQMAEHRIVVYADDYEHATVELELWCLENGVERSGADFLPGRFHDA